jgi:hypothetical protein
VIFLVLHQVDGREFLQLTALEELRKERERKNEDGVKKMKWIEVRSNQGW